MSARFSVVIPTRERADTLHYTIQTCLAQTYRDFEIVVCDNYSSPATKKVIERIDSPKIKYIRSSKLLSMSDNWELAVSNAGGEYIIILGDDDGLLSYSLYEIEKIILKVNLRAIRWERIYYSWPNIPVKEKANELKIPLRCLDRIITSKKVINKIANCQLSYKFLPMLYNSAIHRDLISTLRVKTGRVFKSMSPDVYSGFAFAYLEKRYASIGHPMSINAGSAKSNGIAQMQLDGNSQIANEFYRLNDKAGFSIHPEVPKAKCLPISIADAFLHVKDNLFPNSKELYINKKKLYLNCINALQTKNLNIRDENFKIIRQSLLKNPHLIEWFDSQLLKNQKMYQRIQYSENKSNFDGIKLNLDAAKFNVHDVFGVAKLCENILGYRNISDSLNLSAIHNWRKALRRLRNTARMLLKGF